MTGFIFTLQRFTNDVDSLELTDDEKKAIRESSLPHLRMISNVVKNPLVSKLITTLENFKGGVEFISKDVLPLYSVIAAIYKQIYGKNAKLKLVEDAAILTSGVKIIDSILDFVDESAGLETEKIFTESSGIINEMLKICDNISKVEGNKSTVISLVTAAISYTLSFVSTFDGLTPEDQKKINQAALKLGVKSITSALKEMGKNLDKVTAPFGWASAGIAVGLAIIEGISQYGDKIDYYNDDGLPEDIVRKEAIMDAVASGLHEGLSEYLKGADDVAFKAGQFLGEGYKLLAHAFSGSLDSYDFSISDKNYMDFIREIAKRGEYSSSSDADAITVSGSSVSLYAQDGDDYIENFYSNVTILAGHGNDIVSSYGSAKYNSILGGNGNDYLYVYDTGSTLEGGKNDDHLLIYKDKNTISGNEGNDIIIVQGNSNTVSGGADTDLIDLSGSTKSVVEYTKGDGVDAVFGYDTSTVIKIKGDYSTQASGDDVIIQVGNGGLIVKDVAALKLNINTIELAEGETLPTEQGAFITNPYDNAVILMPGLWGTEKALRGTNSGDRIENTLDNIMVYGLGGDDTIINYGKNVTINAGAGADKVYNYGATVKINGGDDNDYIYNEAARVTISGGGGKDTINNTGNNSRIDGGDDMDSIKNSGENTDINSGYGNDRIINLASNVRAYSYADDNYISNTKNNVTLEGGDEDDTIFNSGSNVSINAGAGNNSVSIDGAAGGYQTVVAGDGQNTIQVGERDETEEKRSRNQITVGDGNNFINNSNVERSTIETGSGNDTIITGGGDKGDYYTGYAHTEIHAGAGNNQISVNSSMTEGEIYAGAGNDLISIAGDGNNNIVSIGSGDDSVIADIGNSTINVGAGKNFVSLSNGGNNIIAGSGDDLVTMTGGGNTTSLGSGNNTLVSENGRENITAGDGNDFITVRGGNLNLGGGKNNISITYGGDTTINTGADDDTINVADKAEEATEGRYYHNINAGDGNNYINNSNVERSTIETGSGNDTIITGGGDKGDYYTGYAHTEIHAGAGNNQISVNSSMTEGAVYAGAGNDLVSIAGDGNYNHISVGDGRNTIVTENHYAYNYNDRNTIEAGSGSDVIYTIGQEAFINAGSGRNSISVGSGRNNTIVTGKGNDTITFGDDSNNNVIIFGEGNDLIINYHEGDTVKAAGAISQSTVGADVVLLFGKSKMTLQGASGKRINTQELSSNDNIYKILVADKTVGDTLLPDGTIVINPNDSTPTALSINNTISATLIEGTELNDTITNSGAKVTITGKASDDFITNSGKNVLFKYATGDGNDLITGFNETSTLQIGGGKGSYSAEPLDNDVIVTVGDAKITLRSAASLTSVQIDGIDKNPRLITGTSKADTFKNLLDRATITALGGKDTIRNYGDGTLIDGGTSNDNIRNYGDDTTVEGGTGNDAIRNYADNVTLSGGAGNDTLRNYGEEILFKYTLGDGNDVITGFNETSTLSIGGGVHETTTSGKNIIVTVGTGKITLKDAADIMPNIINPAISNLDNDSAAKITLDSGVFIADASARTKATRIVGNALDNSILGGTGKDTLAGAAGKDYLFGGAGNDSLSGGDGDDTLEGDKGNDKLIGGTGNDSLNGGDGADTLNGGTGNDTFTGGAGDDIFIYSAGNDVITDYAAGDKISLGASVSKASLKGSDAILIVGNDTLTIKNAKELTLIDAKGTELSTIIGSVKYDDISTAKVTLASGIEIGDASSRTVAIRLTGNALDNSILGGSGKDSLYGSKGADSLVGNAGADKLYGQDGNDTLWGGAGNDTLSGGTGVDTFIYNSGEGKDVITDFSNDDFLQITGTFSATYNSSANTIAFKVGSTASAITLKNCTATSFNVNGDSYIISENNLVKK